MNLEGKPVPLRSGDDAARYAEEMFSQLKEMGARMTLDIHSTDCRVSSTLAYCTVEFDLKATPADGSTMLQPSRNTIVLRKGDGGWKWAHWHSSLAALPAPPASPPGAVSMREGGVPSGLLTLREAVKLLRKHYGPPAPLPTADPFELILLAWRTLPILRLRRGVTRRSSC